MKNLFKNIIVIFLVFSGLLLIFSYWQSSQQEDNSIAINELVTYINNNEVKEIEVDGSTVTVLLNDESEKVLQKEPGQPFSELMANYGVEGEELTNIQVKVAEESQSNIVLITLLQIFLPLILIIGFIWFMSRQVQGANNKAMTFGQSQVRDSSKIAGEKKKLKDVAGMKEAKEEVTEIVEFLKTPKKFTDLGAKIPKGVLMIGPPGTGKTLLARAIAGEAGVPFFLISGSEFVEMFVGVGASRVRDLFKKAKKAAPCIIFIDEIDAVGRQRGAGLGGSHDEREQTLNQILVEMDGFESGTNVIVIAATNRPDVLDPALLRPGRFDRRVTIDLPDITERHEILQIHAEGKPFDSSVDLKHVAERTPGFSGADLANLLNEAAIWAARGNKKDISQRDILDSIEKVLLGPERRSRVFSDKEKEITAYHEAAHALVAHVLPNTDPVQKVSIVSRGRAGGYTLKMPESDKHYRTRSEFLEDLAVSLAGHVIEKDKFGEVTTGPSSDLQQVSKMARAFVTQFGMSENLAPRAYGQREEMVFLGKEIHERRDYSEKTAQLIDDEVARIINDAYEQARTILKDKKGILENIVTALKEKETLERDEFTAIVDGKSDKEDKSE
ncbi:MAG: ATP-dependent zinc metalloprotease FtsH [Patescibacteria group bacterium]